MEDEAYVSALYRLILGREPDTLGLDHWKKYLQDGGDSKIILKVILESDEYLSKNVTLPNDFRAGILQAIKSLQRRINIVDIGAQTLSYEKHIYNALCTEEIPHHVIGFEPLSDRMLERINDNENNLTMLPYAIGDGKQHVLYVNNEDATSSLFPLNFKINQYFEHLSGLQTVRQEPVDTRSLDEVLPDGPVDFLKLDVQGAEDMIFQAADSVLERTGVIHCEVEFSQIYADQPLYPIIQSRLNDHGFALIDLLVSHRYSYIVPSGRRSSDRLLWADAIFFKDDVPAEMLLTQAAIALLVYGKMTLAEHLLQRYNSFK